MKKYMSKKLGIISDTHNKLRPEVLEILKTCDCILHAGDVTKEEILDQIRFLGNLYVVRGNNDGDWAKNIAKVLKFEINGVNFVMAHEASDRTDGRCRCGSIWTYPQVL